MLSLQTGQSTLTSTGGEPQDNVEPGMGPIFVPRLQCPSTPSATAYEECLNENLLGLSECDHSRDIGVVCDGR